MTVGSALSRKDFSCSPVSGIGDDPDGRRYFEYGMDWVGVNPVDRLLALF